MSSTLDTCCICLEKSQHLLGITQCNFGDIKCIEKLEMCLPNKQWEEMLNLCNDCAKKLDCTFEFVQLCVKSEEYRKEQIKSYKTAIVSENVQENVVYTDFTCYLCSKSFRLKRTLSLHITRIHIKPKKNVQRKTSLAEEVSDENLKNLETEDTQKEATNIANSLETAANLEASDGEDSNYFNDSSSDDDVFEEKKMSRLKRRGPKLKGPQKCQYCELEFTRTDRYVHHVRTKHTFEKPFKCELCEAKYFSQHNLNIHMRKHRNEKPFVCSTCGKCFVSSNDLWQHNKIHDNVRQYGCDECDRSFKTHSNLRTHKLQMHQDPESWKFVCTVCGKKFPLNNNLIKHMRRHEGIKDFLCHLCDKKFVEKIDLQTHLLSHSNERHFKCSICCKEYKKKETLRRHMKIEHDLGNFVVKKPEKKLTCPMCPKIFAFNNKLQRHILTHTGEKPVKCDCCDKRFRDTYDRNNHLRHVHNIEPKHYTLLG